MYSRKYFRTISFIFSKILYLFQMHINLVKAKLWSDFFEQRILRCGA